MPQPNLPELTQSLLDLAAKAGADQADAMALTGQSLSIEMRSGVLEQAERSEGTDVGLRVMVGQKQACVSASDTRMDTLRDMAERAVAMAREAPDDPNIALAEPEALWQGSDLDLDLFEDAAEPDPTRLQDLAARAEAAALGNQGITQVQSAATGWGQRDVHLAASNGFSAGYRRSGHSLSCVAIAGEGTGMERDHDGDSRVYQSDMRSPEDIGQTAAERTLARIGARKPQTGTFPVLFDERISSSLISHLLAAANGTAIARGQSWLRDALGEEVLPAGLSVIEDPRRPRVSGSRLFDGEGLPTQRREIVRDGVLTGWTTDIATARKLGMSSTANAARGTGSPPSPSNWNIALTQGDHSRADLMRDMGTGLLVTSMIGSTINPNTGDYSRGASGIWIENGAPAFAVNECTIAGNLRDMLGRIIPANDARAYLSRVVPSLLVEGMTIAGT